MEGKSPYLGMNRIPYSLDWLQYWTQVEFVSVYLKKLGIKKSFDPKRLAFETNFLKRGETIFENSKGLEG